MFLEEDLLILRNRVKTEAAIVHICAKLSGMDLIERFSLYSDQNQIFQCKIKMKQGNVNNNGFHVDLNNDVKQSFDHGVTVRKSLLGVKLGIMNCQSIGGKLDCF